MCHPVLNLKFLLVLIKLTTMPFFQVYANLALLLLNTVIPVVVMTTLNIKIYRTMRRFHKVCTG